LALGGTTEVVPFPVSSFLVRVDLGELPRFSQRARETGHPACFVERIPCGVRRWGKRARGPSTAERDSKGESRSFAQDDNFKNKMTISKTK
jgi:hypothetical protein